MRIPPVHGARKVFRPLGRRDRRTLRKSFVVRARREVRKSVGQASVAPSCKEHAGGIQKRRCQSTGVNMKIISGWKDYYDHVAHQFGGGDPKVRYERDFVIPDENLF